MAQPKMTVRALQPFAHGNVDAKQGGVYAMNKGEAEELVKAGFAEAADGKVEQTQIDQPAQVKQKGDVVTDDADDLLGDGKAAQTTDNKVAQTTRNKSAK